ncbi:hydrolase, TatD family [Pseudopedobacter saltans DSM 12145]|uniref:Hydrolase, TatD family n=1 Tax=Pseudopedobacter saltans (strain ATCC 51119 / DSM 12145 / JCM 21818 / CCUG 39354 / LMG 10337 / NBRC 100064 / NCIMB 13643) TaxID=762903 RepID=F0S4W3_PSESL|nr:TatD family hydrolase [Pseudopedobacter saltans]ADY54137.1 hydrolase, TatD family [Pseudopedobacter saltans DSM 12145]
MILTDTHTHIYYEEDLESRDSVIQRCINNHITRLFLPNVNTDSIPLIDNICAAYPGMCFPMLGLHPCDVKESYKGELAKIYSAIADRKIYAIGEIGIDLYWDKSTLDIQRIAFKEQINWAKSLELPIVIHCREAFDEVFEVLEEEKDEKLRGIFHCFTGNGEQAQRAIDLNFYLGIGGVVTYKKAGLDQVLKSVALEHLVLETDAPYLAPVPYRGKKNESSYLIYVADKVAEIYETTIEHIAEVTTANSVKIFGV